MLVYVMKNINFKILNKNFTGYTFYILNFSNLQEAIKFNNTMGKFTLSFKKWIFVCFKIYID